MHAEEEARRAIDAAHAADPNRTPDGRPAELVYADRMEAWVVRLNSAAPTLLRLAARCQHLERWQVPRATFPEGRPGYLAWRRSLYTRQAERARVKRIEDEQTMVELLDYPLDFGQGYLFGEPRLAKTGT